MRNAMIRMLVVPCLMILISAGICHAVPAQINFQGTLEDVDGPVTDILAMTFRLFDTDSGGTPLWEEEQEVDIDQGIYNVILGTGVTHASYGTMEEAIFSSDVLWIEVHISGEASAMSPRQTITSTAFAMKSGDADSLEGNTTADLDGRYLNEGQTGGVTSAMIADSAIGAADLGADSVGASEIAAGAVLTEITGEDGAGSGLDADLLDGHDTSFFMPAATDNWVNTSGDTMTGTLNLPANGLRVGTNQLIATAGRIGLGATQPNEQLELTGNLRLPITTATTGIIRSGADTLIHTYGSFNFFAGENAGNLTMTGPNNTAMGYAALRANTGGYANTATGVSALGENTTGYDNTAFGYYAGFLNTQGHSNTFVGKEAGYSNTTGIYNTFLGKNAGQENLTGSQNAFLGYASGEQNTGGFGNAFLGCFAGNDNTTGGSNTFVGNASGNQNTTGDRNTFVG